MEFLLVLVNHLPLLLNQRSMFFLKLTLLFVQPLQHCLFAQPELIKSTFVLFLGLLKPETILILHFPLKLLLESNLQLSFKALFLSRKFSSQAFLLVY